MSTPVKEFNKRRIITLEEKKAIIEAADKKNNTELAKDFGIARGTIHGILKDKASILEVVDRGSKSKRARVTSGRNEHLDEALIQWIKQVRSQNVPITGDLLKVRTLILISC